MDTARELTYLGNRVSAGDGGCRAAATDTTRCGWVEIKECGELLHGGFPLKVKRAVYKSYVRPAKLYGNGAWCLKQSKMGIL